ncbi:MAG TPA: hypothetical protein VD788_07900, partial [Candidatus Polarisedimenticolaceae bacterium]|nr:hypothetical protein [Candidatus Polarisedimenticolaceae bacterium]
RAAEAGGRDRLRPARPLVQRIVLAYDRREEARRPSAESPGAPLAVEPGDQTQRLRVAHDGEDGS